MAAQIWANIGSGNGLLPNGTKPLPEPVYFFSWVTYCDIHLTTILKSAQATTVNSLI